ncbi:MAG: hypothetical protein Tsb0021_15060 [Chlamydiales bacterium]
MERGKEEFIKTEGIILKSFPYQESDQILQLYTESLGRISVIVKGARSRKQQKTGLINPLTQLEVIVKIGRGDLYYCKDLSLINLFPRLRSKLSHLEASCKMAQSLYTIHMPGRPDPPVYHLLFRYLSAMETASSPLALTASFCLKLLKHEGSLHLQDTCLKCGEPLRDCILFQGAFYCLLHSPAQNQFAFSDYERTALQRLVDDRSLSSLQQIPIDLIFYQKILQIIHYWD